MLKRLAACVREYKLPAVLTLIFIVGEAVIETIIPFLTANLINDIKNGAQLSQVIGTGVILIVLAVLLLLWCIIRLAGGSYNPFIYFRF